MNFENNCKVCPKNVHCCIFKNDSGFAFISIADAKLIKKETKKAYSDFLDYTPLPNKIISNLKDDDPVLEGSIRYSQIDNKKRLLRLKKKADGRCVFLNNNHRCEIYNVRPSVCRIYPFWAMKLISGKIKIIEHDSNSQCGIIKDLLKKNKDVEKTITVSENKKIKKLFSKINKENIQYKKKINEFAVILDKEQGKHTDEKRK